MMNNSKYIVSFDAAEVGFHKKGQTKLLLENLNMKMKPGELTGLIGRNGAGKSTLLRSMVCLQPLLNGSIKIYNEDIHTIHPNTFARLIAFVSSGQVFTETMTVRELVCLGRFPYTNWIGRLTPSDMVLIDEALVKVGIEHLEKRMLSEISDGERQKAMIARTLAQDTPIIVLDEPTAFLDLPSKYDIISILRDLTRKGKIVVYSTHDLNIALRFSDKIWLINENWIHDGSPEDLILDKTIAGIFDSDKIYLNQLTGDFDLRKNFTKTISLGCEVSDLAYWTMQALQRSGFEIVDRENEVPHVIVEQTNDKIIWKVHRFNENLSFESIYDMLSALLINHEDMQDTEKHGEIY